MRLLQPASHYMLLYCTLLEVQLHAYGHACKACACSHMIVFNKFWFSGWYQFYIIIASAPLAKFLFFFTHPFHKTIPEILMTASYSTKLILTYFLLSNNLPETFCGSEVSVSLCL